MKKLMLSLLLTGSITLLNSVYAQQSYLNQVIVLNEGPWGGPASVGAYDPITKIYQNFDVINASFASDVLVADGFIYVAADTLLIKYDADTYQRLAVQTVKGIRELAIWNDQILVSRADIAPLPSYFQVYLSSDLSFVYELSTVSERASEIEVIGDKAFMAVNGWGTVGKIAVIDLLNQVLETEVDLGIDGLNPEALYKQQGNIFTVNALDWSASSVSKYSISGNTVQNQKFYYQSACAGSAMYLNNIYFQPYTDTTGSALNKSLGVINGNSLSIWDTLGISQSIYGLGIDSMNAAIYIGTTDYTTYGKVYNYSFFGQLVDSFDVDISPGTFAFDVRSTSNISSRSNLAKIIVGPNPANKSIEISTSNYLDKIEIFDLFGRLVYQKEEVKAGIFTIDIQHLSSGLYTLKASEKNLSYTQIIARQ